MKNEKLLNIRISELIDEIDITNYGLDEDNIRDIESLPGLVALARRIVKENKSMPKGWQTSGYFHHKHNEEIKRILADLRPVAQKIEKKTDISLLEFLEEVQRRSNKIISKNLSEDIITKGKEMTEIYYYLYFIENFLRKFIKVTAEVESSDDFSNKLTISSSIEDNVSNRKEQEENNKWIGIKRGDPVYYLDFKDLGRIIITNWSLFESYFPNQNWIKVKIDELAEIRNLVAHNSYIEEHQKDVVRINFNSIINQIGNV